MDQGPVTAGITGESETSVLESVLVSGRIVNAANLVFALVITVETASAGDCRLCGQCKQA